MFQRLDDDHQRVERSNVAPTPSPAWPKEESVIDRLANKALMGAVLGGLLGGGIGLVHFVRTARRIKRETGSYTNFTRSTRIALAVATIWCAGVLTRAIFFGDYGYYGPSDEDVMRELVLMFVPAIFGLASYALLRRAMRRP